LEAQTTVSNSTQCGLLIGEYKKYTLSGVTFSFITGLKTYETDASKTNKENLISGLLNSDFRPPLNALEERDSSLCQSFSASHPA